MSAAATPTSNKPPDDAFHQQKMQAWQPIMTPLKVVIIFVCIGVSFIPTGVTLLKISNDVSRQQLSGTSVFALMR